MKDKKIFLVLMLLFFSISIAMAKSVNFTQNSEIALKMAGSDNSCSDLYSSAESEDEPDQGEVEPESEGSSEEGGSGENPYDYEGDTGNYE